MGCQIELDFNGLLIGTTEITIAYNSLMSYSADLYSYGTEGDDVKLIGTVSGTNMITIPTNESTDRYFIITEGNFTTSSYLFSFLQGS